MTHITVKVCGITRLDDARRSIALGADLLGFNFWPKSPRHVDYETVQSIVNVVKGKAVLVGVWVDPDPEEVRYSLEQIGLDLAQFHGNESPDDVRPFFTRALKAFQVDESFDPEVLRPWKDAWGYLFDCASPGLHGGGGQAWPYERIADLRTLKPQILAGGLSPGNVADAIDRSGATILDVCSSVEARPGVKDPDLLESFFREVRHVQEDS